MTIIRRIFSIQFAFLSRRQRRLFKTFIKFPSFIHVVVSLNFFDGVIIIIIICKASNERKVVACSLENIREREDGREKRMHSREDNLSN